MTVHALLSLQHMVHVRATPVRCVCTLSRRDTQVRPFLTDPDAKARAITQAEGSTSVKLPLPNGESWLAVASGLSIGSRAYLFPHAVSPRPPRRALNKETDVGAPSAPSGSTAAESSSAWPKLDFDCGLCCGAREGKEGGAMRYMDGIPHESPS